MRTDQESQNERQGHGGLEGSFSRAPTGMSLGFTLVNKQRHCLILTVGIQVNIPPHVDFLLLLLNLEGHHFSCNKMAAQQEIDNIILNCNHI